MNRYMSVHFAGLHSRRVGWEESLGRRTPQTGGRFVYDYTCAFFLNVDPTRHFCPPLAADVWVCNKTEQESKVLQP